MSEKKLICPDCNAALSKCQDLKLIVCWGELTVTCPLCGVRAIPIEIKNGKAVNREGK